MSDATALEMSKPALAPYHPALSLPEFLDSFGPLVFPLYRAALLRKRILLVAEAPIHQACNYGMHFSFCIIFNLLLISNESTIFRYYRPYLSHFFRCSLRKGCRLFDHVHFSVSVFMIYPTFQPLSIPQRALSRVGIGLLARLTMF